MGDIYSDLINEYEAWQRAQGLMLGSADEHLTDENLTGEQRKWLADFCQRWESVEPRACFVSQDDRLFLYIVDREEAHNGHGYWIDGEQTLGGDDLPQGTAYTAIPAAYGERAALILESFFGHPGNIPTMNMKALDRLIVEREKNERGSLNTLPCHDALMIARTLLKQHLRTSLPDVQRSIHEQALNTVECIIIQRGGEHDPDSPDGLLTTKMDVVIFG